MAPLQKGFASLMIHEETDLLPLRVIDPFQAIPNIYIGIH